MCSGKIYELWHSKLTFSFMLNRLVQCVYLTRVNCVLWICSSDIGLILIMILLFVKKWCNSLSKSLATLDCIAKHYEGNR